MKTNHQSAVVFANHTDADVAVRALASSGFDLKNVSVIGKGYHTEEQAVGFYNIGERVTFWGTRGAFWGGLWGLFLGGLFLTVPIVGSVVVVGSLAGIIVSTIEGAVVFGGISAIGAALASLGIPKDSVMTYETAVKTDKFLVVVHGSPQDMQRAHKILDITTAFSFDAHEGVAA